MTPANVAHDAKIRLWIYQHFAETGRAPSPVEIGAEFGLTPATSNARSHVCSAMPTRSS